MILRTEFLKSLGLAVAAAASPLPSPSPSASPDPWDMCEDSQALPYDRPLGLKLQVLDGPDFDLTKYRGKPTLLNVFASWCGPCNAEMPYLVEAAYDIGDRLAVVAINDRESDNTVRAFRKKYDIAFPIAMDRSGWIVRTLEAGSNRSASVLLPTTFFIDPNGYLYCDKVGDMSRSELRYRLKRFLAASTPSPSPAASSHL